MKSTLIKREKIYHVVRYKIMSYDKFNENSFQLLLSTTVKGVAFEQYKRYKKLYETACSSYTIAILTKSYSVQVSS